MEGMMYKANVRKIVTILTDENTDYKAIAVRLAREQPETFLKYYQQGIVLPYSVVCEIDAHIAAGNKVGAIKVHRGYTNMGLKESKDIIDVAYAAGRFQN